MHASADQDPPPLDGEALWMALCGWAAELGFSQITVADAQLGPEVEAGLQAWIEAGHHGGMDYMAAHGAKRARPAELVPGTTRVICARMDYLPADGAGPGPALPGGGDADGPAPASDGFARASGGGAQAPWPAGAGAPPGRPAWVAAEQARQARPGAATVSLYARGRDYHKVLRQRLQRLADRLAQAVGPFGHRVFTDSAPVMEVELAQRSGLGWRGRHTLLLSREGGSMFFLGEIFTDLPLPLSAPTGAHCGACTACQDACPTGAILGPQRLDARRCLSYLSIEHEGPIPREFRAAMGNRIYGCDDCQLVCPWNKYARRSPLPDFEVREDFRDPGLLQLWAWDEAAFLRRTEGSAIRRIGFLRWRRNLIIALGNAWQATGEPAFAEALQAERQRPGLPDWMHEHLDWALGG